MAPEIMRLEKLLFISETTEIKQILIILYKLIKNAFYLVNNFLYHRFTLLFVNKYYFNLFYIF